MFEGRSSPAGLRHARAADRGRVSARLPTHFLARARKWAKNTSPLSATPLQSSGATCVVTLAGCAAQLALRQRRAAQTNGGKPDHEAFALFGANATPQAPRHMRSQRGGARSGHRCARPGSCPGTPLCLRLQRPVQAAGGCAAGHSRFVIWLAPVCLSVEPKARSELGRTAAWAGRCRLPRSEAKGSQTAGAHFFGYFLVAEQESTSPAGAKPGLCQMSKHVACNVNSTQAMGAAHP